MSTPALDQLEDAAWFVVVVTGARSVASAPDELRRPSANPIAPLHATTSTAPSASHRHPRTTSNSTPDERAIACSAASGCSVDERRIVEVVDAAGATKADPVHDPLAGAVVGVALGDQPPAPEKPSR